MSLENYTVAIKLSLVQNVSKGLLSMSQQFTALNGQAVRFQQQLSTLRTQIAFGAQIFGIGAALAAPLVYATIQGGKLEKQMRMVQLATNSTTTEMEKFHKAISKTAMSSMYDVATVAAISKTIASAGNFSIGQVQDLTTRFTQYAQAQQMIKGTPVEKSVDQAIKMAEITGHFDPKSIEVSLNALTKLSLLMPGSVDKVLSAFKYMEGTMKNVMGLSDEQSLLLVAFMQRMGIEGTRAGSALLAFVTRSIPKVFGSGLWEGQSLQNLGQMGMLDANGTPKIYTNGKFDPAKLFHGLADFVTKTMASMPEDQARSVITKTLSQTFGMNGTRIASQFLTPQAMQSYAETEDAYKKRPDLDTLTYNLANMFNFQLPRVGAGIKTIFEDIGWTILPTVTKGLQMFGNALESIDAFINNHPTFVRVAASLLAFVAAGAILGGTLIMLRAGIMGLVIPFEILGLFARTLLPTLMASLTTVGVPLLLTVAELGLLGYALYYLYTQSTQLIDKFKNTKIFAGLEAAFYTLGDVVSHIIHPIDSLGQAFNFLSGSLSQGSEANNAAYFRNNARIYNENHKPSLRMRTANTPIHLAITVLSHLDGEKVASAVVNRVYHHATQVPNTGSVFDSSLSPTPTILNNMGYA